MSEYLAIHRRTAQAVLDENGPFFIIWNPGSDITPSVIYRTGEAAWKVAEALALKNPGERFFVLQSDGHAVRPPSVIRNKAVR